MVGQSVIWLGLYLCDDEPLCTGLGIINPVFRSRFTGPDSISNMIYGQYVCIHTMNPWYVIIMIMALVRLE